MSIISKPYQPPTAADAWTKPATTPAERRRERYWQQKAVQAIGQATAKQIADEMARRDEQQRQLLERIERLEAERMKDQGEA